MKDWDKIKYKDSKKARSNVQYIKRLRESLADFPDMSKAKNRNYVRSKGLSKRMLRVVNRLQGIAEGIRTTTGSSFPRVQINKDGGLRTWGEQQKLREAYLAGTGGRAAPPGPGARHMSHGGLGGMAVDISFGGTTPEKTYDESTIKKLRELYTQKYGEEEPLAPELSDDIGHFELKDVSHDKVKEASNAMLKYNSWKQYYDTVPKE